MAKFLCFLVYLCLALGFSLPVSGTFVKSLLVFGDSLLDTGNDYIIFNGFPPYPNGITYPGNSTGRLSDGLIFTDMIAEYLGVRPVPTPFMQIRGPVPPSGVNFAIAGAGVYVPSNRTNLVAQVDAFENLVRSNGISTAQVESSLVLLSIGGNDYTTLFRNGTTLDQQNVSQIAPVLLDATLKQLERIFNQGARKFAILNLPPGHCSPAVTIPFNSSTCLSPDIFDVQVHNDGYMEIQQRLISAGAHVTILDAYSAVLYVLNHLDCFGLAPSLKPCCAGFRKTALKSFSCGDVNHTSSSPLYTLCPNPKTSFFWDTVHPTQATWKAISSLFFFSTGYTMPGPNLCKAINVRCPDKSSEATSGGTVLESDYCGAAFSGGAGLGDAPPIVVYASASPPRSQSDGTANASPTLLLLALIFVAHLFFLCA